MLAVASIPCVTFAVQGSVSPANTTQQAVELKGPPPRSAYAGDAACLACHHDLSASFAHTAHHFTSQLPSAESVHGSFAPGENVLKTSNPRLTFEMDATAGGAMTETARYLTHAGQLQQLTEPIDLVVGSGRKGQTYLWWASGLLFELPVSYWTAAHSWINSPGYEDGTAHFDRVIPPQCLECHASYFEPQPPAVNHFVRSSLILGIGCERCHGPGAEHVRREQERHRPTPGSAAEAIVNPARLSRDRQIDVCALCHSGPGQELAPALSFQPGEVLADFVRSPPIVPGAPIDVHTNQVQLLRESACFRSSAMTCSTCHDVHTTQRDPAAFAPKCLGCHRMQQCGEFKTMHAAIRTRCVGCHMPLQQSQTLVFDNDGKRLAPSVRTHRIAVYAQVTPEGDANKHP